MHIQLVNARRENTHCNFCSRGQLTESKDNFIYPYEEVLVFRRIGNGLSATICKDCLSDLYKNGLPLFTK